MLRNVPLDQKETRYRHLNGKVVVYSITNLLDNKKYIGSTICFYKRRSCHVRDLERNKHHSILLQRAYNKYGSESFEFEILEVFEDKSNRVFYEQKWMDLINSCNPKFGYNVSKQASETGGARLMTLEERKRHSERMKEVFSKPGEKEKRSEFVKKWASTPWNRKRFSEMYHSRPRPRQSNDKLTNDQVMEIISRVENGEKQKDIYKDYGICQSMVSRIVTKSRHKNVLI